MEKEKKCPHGQPSSCSQCSKVRMVAYTHSDDQIVWYSFFKEDKKYLRPENIAVQMGLRLEKKFGKNIKKMMFFANKEAAKPVIAES